MKAYINRRPVEGPWGGGNMWVKAMHDNLSMFGIDVVPMSEQPDVVFIAGIGSEGQDISAFQAIGYKKWAESKGKKVKLVFRVNENDARKGTSSVDRTIEEISRQCDDVVFVSKWLMDYFNPINWGVKTTYVHNGVDSSVFKPKPKSKDEKIRIVAHHWSDNRLKGADVYEALDSFVGERPDSFSFTYVGRHKCGFKHTRVIGPLWGESLGEELRSHDVYVSASRFDPGPNHVIEAISCGLPTYVHKDGGGCVEFSGLDHVYEDVDALLNLLESKTYTSNTAWQPDIWRACVEKFAKIAREGL